MARTIEVRNPGDPYRYRVKCIHLPGDMRMAYWNDGSIKLEGSDRNVLMLSMENFSDGFHVNLQPYDAPKVNEDDTHEWREGVCHTITAHRVRSALRRKVADTPQA